MAGKLDILRGLCGSLHGFRIDLLEEEEAAREI